MSTTSVTPSIIYRAVDANNDPMWGQGQANFFTDIEAVAQAIKTRLLLFEGEWWEDRSDGLPLWQSIAGQSASSGNLQNINLLIQQRILGTPFVVSVSNVSSSFDPSTRKFSYSAAVQTQFGVLSVTNIPTPPAQGLP